MSHSTRHRADGYALLVDVRIDLRDPTARAHAAWALCEWTATGWRVLPPLREALQAARSDGARWFSVLLHTHMLCCMASGDPTVTVLEARAALEWAEAIEDAAREASEHVHGVLGAAAAQGGGDE